jgi:hypothetical protein
MKNKKVKQSIVDSKLRGRKLFLVRRRVRSVLG